MDQPCSVLADALSKFYTASEPIHALWIIAMPVTLLGAIHLVLRGLRNLILPFAPCCGRGRLLYGLFQDHQGRCAIYQNGQCRRRCRPRLSGGAK